MESRGPRSVPRFDVVHPHVRGEYGVIDRVLDTDILITDGPGDAQLVQNALSVATNPNLTDRQKMQARAMLPEALSRRVGLHLELINTLRNG